MTIIDIAKDRIDTAIIMRRANKKIRAHREAKALRDHMNRPHVQSVHQIGYWMPPKEKTARDYGITRRYVAAIALLFFAVLYLNADRADSANRLARYQVASK